MTYTPGTFQREVCPQLQGLVVIWSLRQLFGDLVLRVGFAANAPCVRVVLGHNDSHQCFVHNCSMPMGLGVVRATCGVLVIAVRVLHHVLDACFPISGQDGLRALEKMPAARSGESQAYFGCPLLETY